MSDVLIVEPDNSLAKIYLGALKKAGHIVRRVKTAQTAIAELDKRKSDIVVLELQLIKHNGIEFLYELRSYTDWQDLPIIIHSFTSPDIMDNLVLSRHIGIAKYLYKPNTSLRDLLTAIMEVSHTSTSTSGV